LPATIPGDKLLLQEIHMPARPRAWHRRIVSSSDLHHGEPCIRGTRIPVSLVVGSLADMSMDDLLREYPQLKPQDIQAALLYAAEAAHNTLVA
jgi:uncharacterized protein (DUF433 family)